MKTIYFFVGIAFAISNVFAVEVGQLLRGQWECEKRIGQLNENTHYEIFCEGQVHLKPNSDVVSKGIEQAFFPTGALWSVEENQSQSHIVLKDSSGQEFARHLIFLLTEEDLQIKNKRGDFYHYKRIK